MTNDFDKNGYIHLKNVLDKNQCKNLTTELKGYVDRKETKYDPQCPKSETIHGAKVFDKLLEDLLPYFEKVSGKKLHPTYSFARLYKPGEELKKHKDRPACEISATVTLGFEGNPWAIYMEGNKVDMQIGDVVLYRGIDLLHWREKYTEGKWQAQVFLHYVDANGPHQHQKYDGREKLGISKHYDEDRLPYYVTHPQHLSEAFCDRLIEEYKSNRSKKEQAPIADGEIDTNIRDVKRVLLPTNSGIGSTLTATALNSNNAWWKYDITHSVQSEFLIYKPEGHYNSHVDTEHKHGNDCRKLTALAFLNTDFEGGEFYINGDGIKLYPQIKKGDVIVFPSYLIHGVEPVLKGTRYSCVAWMLGPYFR